MSVTRLLLDYGAKIDVKDSTGKTLVDYLESSVTGTERVVEFLKAAGGDEEARDSAPEIHEAIRTMKFDDSARVVDVVFFDDGEKIDVIANEDVLKTTVTLDAVTGVFIDRSSSFDRASVGNQRLHREERRRKVLRDDEGYGREWRNFLYTRRVVRRSKYRVSEEGTEGR